MVMVKWVDTSGSFENGWSSDMVAGSLPCMVSYSEAACIVVA